MNRAREAVSELTWDAREREEEELQPAGRREAVEGRTRVLYLYRSRSRARGFLN
jgi:hypothetical protein